MKVHLAALIEKSIFISGVLPFGQMFQRWSGSWSNGQLVEGHFVPVPDGRLYNRMSNNPMYIRPSAPGEFRRLCTVR